MLWTPSDIIEAGKLLMQIIEFLAVVVGIVFLKGLRKDVDGRMSQLIDLLARLSGSPNRRQRDEPVDEERRRSANPKLSDRQ